VLTAKDMRTIITELQLDGAELAADRILGTSDGRDRECRLELFLSQLKVAAGRKEALPAALVSSGVVAAAELAQLMHIRLGGELTEACEDPNNARALSRRIATATGQWISLAGYIALLADQPGRIVMARGRARIRDLMVRSGNLYATADRRAA